MGSCAAPSAKGDDKFITTDYLQQCLPDYLDHIQQAATDARSFVEGMAKDDFLADKRTQQAVIMSLIVIGEAATKVMDGYVEFTQAHADVPWRSMRNMRNRMAHGYFDINLDVVWETVQEWLPALLQQLPAVRQDADDEDRNDNCERGISDDC
ncbi:MULTISPECIES: HepT-like ribonuclease domain-containing protein [Enterobacteriaceae]|jgi:uncharacterized protein with HEPN domain|nr:DUF86 domain-containing protein [Klebsiella variicola]